MSKTITAIPESITREQYTSLIEAVGMKAKDLASLRFAPSGVYAEVIDRDDQGARRYDRDGIVKNLVFIPVVGEVSA